ncbi:COesterase domain containing protein [Asbolus verrucosus]|uniref:COesterase domain containing protein n=1 Tax=Asbolus verrucosus TaxID=1661398 RepID=A0A482V7F0_ASBVE|nr:COesterase domain containing protein [Asbolus verrucosus]
MSTKIVLIVLILSHFDNSLADPLIKLPNGLIQGRQGITFHNTTFYAFEKIPYAAPPVGELRFQAPKPPQNWEGTLNATHLDVSCHQEGTVGDYESEDCLYINVFTPQLPSEDDNVSLPVMFFIHGGAFKVGSSMNLASDLITDNGVILGFYQLKMKQFQETTV